MKTNHDGGITIALMANIEIIHYLDVLDGLAMSTIFHLIWQLEISLKVYVKVSRRFMKSKHKRNLSILEVIRSYFGVLLNWIIVLLEYYGPEAFIYNKELKLKLPDFVFI